jgi:hypothetical protein
VAKINIGVDLALIANSFTTNRAFVIGSNLRYINKLELGSSAQAPDGIINHYLPEYQRVIDAAGQKIITGEIPDADTAIELAVQEILKRVVEYTPVDTGAAKNSWVVNEL